jgi:hypothetical protein
MVVTTTGFAVRVKGRHLVPGGCGVALPVPGGPSRWHRFLDEQQHKLVGVRQDDVVLYPCRGAYQVTRADVEHVDAHGDLGTPLGHCADRSQPTISPAGCRVKSGSAVSACSSPPGV